MGIFKNIFRSKDKGRNEESLAVPNYNSAKKAFDEENYREALRLLIFAFNEDSGFKPAYELSALTIDRLGGQEEAELFKEALSDFNNYKPFYDLGYHYVDVSHTRLAIPFLKRAVELSGNLTEVAVELAVAYTSQFQPEKALEVLKKVELGDVFWNWYEYYWCSLLCGEVEHIEGFIAAIRKQFKEISEDSDSNIKNIFYVLDKLEECYKRYKTIENAEKIIKHWHYIQYGAAILDYFDEETSEEALKVAGGRYVAKFGNYAEVKITAHKLKDYLTKLECLPKTVYSLPGRDSEILGKVIAKVFNLRWEEYDTEKNAAKCLIVAASNSDFDEYYDQFNTIVNDQIVFAMNHNWLHGASVTPDISGFMTQSYIFPWQGGGLKVNQETNQVESIPADERAVEEIVETIVMEKVEMDTGFDEILAFYYERKEYLKGVTKENQKRLPFSVDSPVKGSYFC